MGVSSIMAGKSKVHEPDKDERFFEEIRKATIEVEREMGSTDKEAKEYAEKLVKRTKTAYFLGKRK